MKKVEKVLISGNFNILHPGHLRLFVFRKTSVYKNNRFLFFESSKRVVRFQKRLFFRSFLKTINTQYTVHVVPRFATFKVGCREKTSGVLTGNESV